MKVFLVITIVFAYAAGACQDGWMSHGGECYLFSHDTENWASAMDICHFMGASLAEVESADEDSYLRSQLGNIGGNFWIGLTDLSEEGSYVWMTSGEKITSDAFTNWHTNQPDNSAHNENCVHYYEKSGEHKWNDYPCSRTQQYICEQNSDPGTEIVG